VLRERDLIDNTSAPLIQEAAKRYFDQQRSLVGILRAETPAVTTRRNAQPAPSVVPAAAP
jgi:hypothetical protein